MTPKSKAEELVNKYRIILMQSGTDAGEEILCTTIAKQCALVSIDEVLFALKYDMNDPTSGSIRYWNEVKQEIEQL